jgi:hypothetical protein
MGLQQPLPTDHKWRLNARSFDGKQELGAAPIVPQGQGANEEVEWKKKSIFFTLPY